jgi:hypothetical protein
LHRLKGKSHGKLDFAAVWGHIAANSMIAARREAAHRRCHAGIRFAAVPEAAKPGQSETPS